MLPEGPRDFAALSTADMDAFERHCARHLGECLNVWHELESSTVHLDVLPYPPSSHRQAWTFVTMGMSALEMTLPQVALDQGMPRRAELMITLPSDWMPTKTFSHIDFDQDLFMPVGIMKQVARYVHEVSSWFGSGHTVQWGFPDGHPLADFTGFLLAPPVRFSKGLALHTRPDGEEVAVLAMHALYQEELEFKREKGADALYTLADRSDFSDLVDPGRPSLLKQKRFWDRYT